MMAFAYIALFAWVPVVLLLFAFFPPRTASIWSFTLAWLFLPMLGIDVPGLPDWTKMNATTAAVFLGILIFDPARFTMIKWSWLDLPMALWCAWPMITALSMGQGAYEGASFVLDQLMVWGGPYIVGRMYLRDPGAMRELAMAIVIGGLIYVPLCLFEVRMSPQLHRLVYGYHQHSFLQTIRESGYRPMVFMQHGLAVAMWMTGATLIGFWMWWTRAWKVWQALPMGVVVAVLLITTLLCRSTGATLLLFGSLGLLVASRYLSTRVGLVLLLLVPPVYMVTRAAQILPQKPLLETVSLITSESRVKSLATRLDNEDQLVAKALERPIAGWGRMGDARIYNRYGKDISITDGLWVIIIGQTGVGGLVLATTLFLLPAWLTLRRIRSDDLGHPLVAPELAVAVLIMLHVVDNMLNAMVNPIFVLAAGGLTATAIGGFRLRRPNAAAQTTTTSASTPRQPAPVTAAGTALSPPKP